MSDLPKPRLCHLKKWTDFEGYGFHLQAMKDSPGQFIGKVDDGSPAESARLLTGDKIIEVNGVNVEGENHQQVVTRIKAVPNETKLLVIEREAYEAYKKRGIIIRGDLEGVRSYVTADSKSAASTAKGSSDKKEPDSILLEKIDGSRSCFLKLRPDFQGYGFNLQAEKGKPGQFIGKVEAGSPAEVSGLRLGDRLLEVNGVNVTGETHGQVVQRIKAVPGETRLLVVDEDSFARHLKKLAGGNENSEHKENDHVPLTNGSATDLKEKDEDSKSRELEEEHKREIEERLRNYDAVEVVEHRAVDDERHEAETHAHEDHAGHDDHDDHDGGDHREKEEEVVLSHYHEEEQHEYRERDEDEPKTDSYDYNSKFEEEERAALAEVERATGDQNDADDSANEYVNKTIIEPVKEKPVVDETSLPTYAYATINEVTRTPVVKSEPIIEKQVSTVSTSSTSSSTTTPASPGPVTIDGIYFPASAKEMREKMSGKKRGKDPRLNTQLSMTEKYKVFERL